MSEHQYAMVMDLNKCIGCHTCTLACKKQWTDGDGMDYMYWNNVESHPGTGYPRGWHAMGGGFDAQRHLRPSALPDKADYGEPFEYDYGQRLYEGGDKPVMPHVEPTFSPNWDEDVGGFDTTNPYFFYLPRICNHCTHPACLEACPKKAIYKRQEDGIVLIDQERCSGYRYCIKACPYKKIYFNEVKQKSEKCIFCYPRLERGQVNACAAQCPGRIRFVGLLDDPESPVHQLVLKHKVALGLFPEKGTHPNVYYVPPFLPPKAGQAHVRLLDDPRLPLDYLKYLFGDEVVRVLSYLEGELERAQRGERSEVLQLLIGRDNAVRYRIVPHEVLMAAPAEVQKAVSAQPENPRLLQLGTPSKNGKSATPAEHAAFRQDVIFHMPGDAERVAGSEPRVPELVRAAFGMGLVGAALDPLRAAEGDATSLGAPGGDSGCAPSACGGCSMQQPGASRPRLLQIARPSKGGGDPWF